MLDSRKKKGGGKGGKVSGNGLFWLKNRISVPERSLLPEQREPQAQRWPAAGMLLAMAAPCPPRSIKINGAQRMCIQIALAVQHLIQLSKECLVAPGSCSFISGYLWKFLYERKGLLPALLYSRKFTSRFPAEEILLLAACHPPAETRYYYSLMPP